MIVYSNSRRITRRARWTTGRRHEQDKANCVPIHRAVSLPFAGGENRKIAVKIVDDWGIESLKVVPLD
ncbi:hypothetical protein LCC91_08065 [Tepidimonas taiwanensis]|nr:hypothetical protein [Tepidimonas taiwanensis]MCX7672924.1 hypothetical protein [Thiobacillaceae bacterium]UBQ04530.1 hypothetical protein LCC91_08065 [Tepidimonas taiwanensis]